MTTKKDDFDLENLPMIDDDLIWPPEDEDVRLHREIDELKVVRQKLLDAGKDTTEVDKWIESLYLSLRFLNS